MKKKVVGNHKTVIFLLRSLLICSLFVIGLAHPASAATLYSYTGNAFTLSGGGILPCPSDCFITASFTVASPLAANLSDVTITPASYTISDGALTFANANSSPYGAGFGFFSTDGSGAITTWAFEVQSNTVSGQILGTLHVPQFTTGTQDFRADSLTEDAGNANNPGVWSGPPTPGVPEPTTWVLLAGPLAAML
jgi:hypothetical protein